jgi:Tfp pilus assembly protein PilF
VTYGEVLCCLKQNAQAKVEVEKALELAPRDMAAWNTLVWVELDSKDYDGAVKACKAALSIDPNNERVHLGYGNALYYLKKKDAAAEQWMYVAKHGSTDRDAAISDLNRLGSKKPGSVPH